jgi:hypothetical protein
VENLTILIVFPCLQAIRAAPWIKSIPFHTAGFGRSSGVVKNYADFVKSAADANAVLHHS